MLATVFTLSRLPGHFAQQYCRFGLKSCRLLRHVIAVGVAAIAAGCGSSAAIPPRSLPVQQQWELEIGQSIGDYQVSATLGDVSVELKGNAVFAPFTGEVEPMEESACVLFSTPDIPAYLFRLCGLNRPQIGPVDQGKIIGKGRYLHFATLRLQPDGNWAIVEPASDILTRLLTQQSG